MGWLLYFKIETKEERKKGSVIRKSRDAGKTGGTYEHPHFTGQESDAQK